MLECSRPVSTLRFCARAPIQLVELEPATCLLPSILSVTVAKVVWRRKLEVQVTSGN
ncbi:MAG: hypothetical protein LBF72_03260 [Holosporales bacterium]|nr:hypothetical protein [Holosporales bacterium]